VQNYFVAQMHVPRPASTHALPKKVAAQTRARQNTVVTKTLISSYVFNFFDARAFKRRVPFDRANSFNFDRAVE